MTGGFGDREIESLGANCVPLYINDGFSRYLDELLPHGSFELRLNESEVPGIPEALEAAAGRLAEMRQELFCACAALLPAWGDMDAYLHEGWADAELTRRVDSQGLFASLLLLLEQRKRGGKGPAVAGEWLGEELGPRMLAAGQRSACELPSAAEPIRRAFKHHLPRPHNTTGSR